MHMYLLPMQILIKLELSVVLDAYITTGPHASDLKFVSSYNNITLLVRNTLKKISNKSTNRMDQNFPPSVNTPFS